MIGAPGYFLTGSCFRLNIQFQDLAVSDGHHVLSGDGDFCHSNRFLRYRDFQRACYF